MTITPNSALSVDTSALRSEGFQYFPLFYCDKAGVHMFFVPPVLTLICYPHVARRAVYIPSCPTFLMRENLVVCSCRSISEPQKSVASFEQVRQYFFVSSDKRQETQWYLDPDS